MNLATSLLSKNQSLGINFPASGMFSTFNLDDFAKNKFQNFAFSDLNRKNKVFIGDPDMGEPERDKFVESTFKGFVISDDIVKNRLYDVGEVIYGNFYYFISKNGAFLLKKYKDLLSSIGTDEMAVFLEINDGDVFSPAVMHVCAGAKMKKYASSVIPKSEDKTDYVVKNLFDNSYVLTNEQVDNLIASIEKEEDWFKTLLDIIVDTQQALIDGVFYLAINAFDGLAGFFGHTLRIPESFWNPRIKGYSVGLITDSFTVKLNSYVRLAEKELNEWKGILPEFVISGFMSLVGILKSYISNMKAFQKAFEGSLAAAIGFWNGLMDLISSIFLLIKLVLSAINGLVDGAFAGYEYASNTEYYKALFWEYLDNIFQAFIHLDWQEIIESVSNGCAEINAYIKDIPARIVEKLAQLNHAEIGYYTGYGLFVILEFLLPILKVAKLGKLSKLGDVFGDLGKIEIKGNNLIERFSNLMDLFLSKINEGTDGLRKWIDEIFTRFKKWLDDLLGFNKPSEEVVELFRRGKSTTAKGEVLFRRSELFVFSRKLEKKYAHLKLKVNIVTPNSQANSLRLKRWDQRNVLGSFNSGPPPVIHVRQRCTRLTMQHEIWHLDDYSRLGAAEYKKIPNWKHEESVWLKILKSKDQWTESELIDSYKYYKQECYNEGQIPIVNNELEKLI